MIFKNFTLHKLHKHIHLTMILISFRQYFSLYLTCHKISIALISILVMSFLTIVLRHCQIKSILFYTKTTTEMSEKKRFPPKSINCQVITPIITIAVPIGALNSETVIIQVIIRNDHRIMPIALYTQQYHRMKNVLLTKISSQLIKSNIKFVSLLSS